MKGTGNERKTKGSEKKTQRNGGLRPPECIHGVVFLSGCETLVSDPLMDTGVGRKYRNQWNSKMEGEVSLEKQRESRDSNRNQH